MPGQPGADHDDCELPLVGWVDQLHLELVPVPLIGNVAARNLCVECHWPTCLAKMRVERDRMNPPPMTTADTLPAASTRRPPRMRDRAMERLQRRARGADPDDEHAQHVEGHGERAVEVPSTSR